MLRPEGYAGQAGGFMNTLILNREYALPSDGWYQIAPIGDFPHSVAGVIQVIDQEALMGRNVQRLPVGLLASKTEKAGFGHKFAGQIWVRKP